MILYIFLQILQKLDQINVKVPESVRVSASWGPTIFQDIAAKIIWLVECRATGAAEKSLYYHFAS